MYFREHKRVYYNVDARKFLKLSIILNIEQKNVKWKIICHCQEVIDFKCRKKSCLITF